MNRLFFNLYIAALGGTIALSSALRADEYNSVEDLLKEKGRDYPGCVFIVRDEMQYIDEDRISDTVPLLLKACIKGRQIGEKRIEKMYEIDTAKRSPKKKSFHIGLMPIHEDNNKQNILYNE